MDRRRGQEGETQTLQLRRAPTNGRTNGRERLQIQQEEDRASLLSASPSLASSAFAVIPSSPDPDT